MYHATPIVDGQPQYYCFYRKRPGQPGLVPDCPNITQNVAWLVKLFNSMGIDAIVTDTTNLYTYPNNRSDIWNIRPVEVRNWSATSTRDWPWNADNTPL